MLGREVQLGGWGIPHKATLMRVTGGHTRQDSIYGHLRLPGQPAG